MLIWREKKLSNLSIQRSLLDVVKCNIDRAVFYTLIPFNGQVSFEKH